MIPRLARGPTTPTSAARHRDLPFDACDPFTPVSTVAAGASASGIGAAAAAAAASAGGALPLAAVLTPSVGNVDGGDGDGRVAEGLDGGWSTNSEVTAPCLVYQPGKTVRLSGS